MQCCTACDSALQQPAVLHGVVGNGYKHMVRGSRLLMVICILHCVVPLLQQESGQ